MQNGNLDHHQNAHCTSFDKGLYMSEVSWLNMMWFRRFAIPIANAEEKRITRMLQLQATVKRFQFDL